MQKRVGQRTGGATNRGEHQFPSPRPSPPDGGRSLVVIDDCSMLTVRGEGERDRPGVPPIQKLDDALGSRLAQVIGPTSFNRKPEESR